MRSAVERIGRLVFWRVAIKPGRPVAMGVIRAERGESAAFVGLPGNPVAVFVTFVRVVKVLLRRCRARSRSALVPLPVRAAFAYKKKKDRREYVRVALAPRRRRRARSGQASAGRRRRDFTSLTETDGLLELPEDVTAVEPGDARRLPVLRGADGVTDYALTSRTPTGWSRRPRRPAPGRLSSAKAPTTAMTMAQRRR